jgi:hypothetical protein
MTVPHLFALAACGGAGAGAPVEWIANGAATQVDTSPAAPALPVGWSPGDHAIAIALHTSTGSGTTFGITSGWNAIDNPTHVVSSCCIGVWERVLQGGDSAPSITSTSAGAYQAVVITFTAFGAYILDTTDNPASTAGTDYQIFGGPESSTVAGSLALAIHGKQTGVTNSLKSGSEQGYAQVYQYTRASGATGTTRNGLCVASKAVDVESVTMPTFTAGNTFANVGISLILQP